MSGDANYNYKHFAWLRTLNGTILIDGVKVTSWDVAKNDYDTNVADGRSYVLAKGDARLDIANADLSYLGSADGESYGVAWRDTNSDQQPDVLRTRVTGEVLDSTFSYNYSNPTKFVKIGEGFFSGAAPPSPAVRLALLQLT